MQIHYSIQLLLFVLLLVIPHPNGFYILGIIKDLFFNEIDLLTEDKHKESGLYMISWIAQLKDN